MNKKINGINLKQAESNQEMLLLGLVEEISKTMEYGKFTIELAVRKGKLTHVEAEYKIKNSVNLDC